MMKNSNQKKEGAGRLSAILPIAMLMFLAVSVLNGFFPRETKASDPGGFTIAAAEPLTLVQPPSVQQDTSGMDKIKVTGYATFDPRIRGERRPSVQDTAGNTKITVIGYGKQKTDPGNSRVRIQGRSGVGTDPKPVIVVDGVHMDSMDDLDPEQISSVEVHSIDNLIIVRTKSFAGVKVEDDQVMTVPDLSAGKIIYVVDGKTTDKDDIGKINPSDIENITVLKDKESVKIYTSDDVDGVIIINTKEGSE